MSLLQDLDKLFLLCSVEKHICGSTLRYSRSARQKNVAFCKTKANYVCYIVKRHARGNRTTLQTQDVAFYRRTDVTWTNRDNLGLYTRTSEVSKTLFYNDNDKGNSYALSLMFSHKVNETARSREKPHHGDDKSPLQPVCVCVCVCVCCVGLPSAHLARRPGSGDVVSGQVLCH